MNPHRWQRSILAIWSWGDWRRSAAAVPRDRRPVVEPLESRQLLSTIAEFPIPTVGPNASSIAAGPDGKIWFTEILGGKVGMIDPATHAIAEFTPPTAGNEPDGITAGPDGSLWFVEGSSTGNGRIGRIDPTTHAIAEFPLPTATDGPAKITTGPDGNLWFTETSGNKIGMINPTTHAITEFPIPTANSLADDNDITAGPDGNIWFTEGSFIGSSKIGRIDPTTHAIAEFPLPTSGVGPAGITTGPDGNLWFVETYGDKIGMINPTTQSIVEIKMPTAGTEPLALTTGPDGNLWFTEAVGVRIGAINPVTRGFAEFPVPTNHSNPHSIAAGPDGNLWFVETYGGKIGALTPTHGLIATAKPPASITTNAGFGMDVTVSYQSGLVDTTFNGNVSLALVDPGGASLGGMLTVAAKNGVATFSGLTIDRPGSYRFVTFTDPMTATDSTPVTVSVPPVSVPPVVVPPTIVAQKPIFAGKGRRRHVVGYELDFSTAMDPARAAGAAQYTLTQLQRRGRQLVGAPVAVQAAYDATAHSVALTLSGKPKFAQGGRLVVAGAPPGGLTDATGVPLDGGNQGVIGDDGTFVIGPKGNSISR